MIKHVHCCMCDRELHYADSTHDQDDCFKFDDDYVCEDCLDGYCRENYYCELTYEEVL